MELNRFNTLKAKREKSQSQMKSEMLKILIFAFLPAATACRRPTSRFSPSPKFKKFKISTNMTSLIQYKVVRYEKLDILVMSAVCLLSADCLLFL